MTRFRPCIDLHDGKVKQIVGSTLRDGSAGVCGEFVESVSPVASSLQENFVSENPASWFASLYQKDSLTGGHVIMLGKGNETAAREALAAYPGGLQIGGGITPSNAREWINAGASHVIVTSWLFDEHARFQQLRLDEMVNAIGADKLVIDISCRATPDGWTVAMNRWQTLTDMPVNAATFARLAPHCAEFLIHAVDVEGKCEGMDEKLISRLAEWCERPVTYAGGARSIADLQRAHELSGGKVDVTIGSALDIFGGKSARYEDCVAFNARKLKASRRGA